MLRSVCSPAPTARSVEFQHIARIQPMWTTLGTELGRLSAANPSETRAGTVLRTRGPAGGRIGSLAQYRGLDAIRERHERFPHTASTCMASCAAGFSDDRVFKKAHRNLSFDIFDRQIHGVTHVNANAVRARA